MVFLPFGQGKLAGDLFWGAPQTASFAEQLLALAGDYDAGKPRRFAESEHGAVHGGLEKPSHARADTAACHQRPNFR